MANSYIPYLLTVILYLGLANMVGLFGFVPPTKDLNVTIALALMSIHFGAVCCHSTRRGVGGWLKQFCSSLCRSMTPLNLMELVVQAAVSLHATVRQYFGRLYHHGAAQDGDSSGGAADCKHVFRCV